MSNVKRYEKNNFTITDNKLIKDDRLSWKARGIFQYLWAMPSDWNFYVDEVAKHSKNSVGALQSGLSELEKFGYLKRIRLHGKDGHFSRMAWELSDTGDFTINPENHSMENTINGKNHRMGNRPLLNTNNTNKKETLNKKNTKDILSSSHSTAVPEIIDYLNSKIGTHYRATTRKTQSLIKARMNEGFTVDDFKIVIDNKAAEWSKDERMSKYLRPETLFGTKFESYLNQQSRVGKAEPVNDFNFD
ncbi:conserved phage C-terminal domain-containing protein [Ligilactobacillus aviarius]|uniref:Phage conserved hypothetical protein C-terminal domain-containing protein n=1 Tax=Ligilactobacillus aviarius TaxID=1606 RepID=A0A510WSP8_9LACO|nr:conserved phage C-terminal domain-containing protein [Ligilactobacillus aviarius]KRM39093.1 hypothetical protein FC33_GL001502 [Ligilactobacillus aviarius subsp. aviarius DSM 20655]GEK42252.1 hypothetical protein LAV01_10840 [Ligilactobacillus aviarius]